ncbi:MAG: PilW family protein [Roseateles sp.]
MRTSWRQRGLGLVELMVGITVGLIVAAGASMVAVNQITEHRRLMLETQVQQDLRAAADLLQQDLRRAGFRGDATYLAYVPASGVGSAAEEPAQAASANPFMEITEVDSSEVRSVEYTYARSGPLGVFVISDTPQAKEHFGVRWDKRSKALYLKLGLKADGTGNWQPVTDPTTVEIIDFDFQLSTQDIALSEFCDTDCAGANCPRQQVRRIDFTLRGRAVHDGAVVRTLGGTERVRADAVTGACPA